MDDLAERIKASLENPKSDPWFPELTRELVERAWDRLRDDIDLTLHNYGTSRVMSRSVSAPRNIIASLQTWPWTCENAPTIAVETLSDQWASQYHEAGITFYSPTQVLNTEVLTCIEDAISILNQVPSLMGSVARLVRSLHVIRPKNAHHDVSFSEPQIPFSIFVSVPESRIPNDSLRVAEALVHEAMHLQLTLIEQLLPLMKPSSKTYFSPWTASYRPPGGLLHAIYVFAVVHHFLRTPIAERTLANGSIKYSRDRRNQIRRQVLKIRGFQHCSDLTLIGSHFVKTLTQDLINGV
jgi:HEXXH motif-containing protein